MRPTPKFSICLVAISLGLLVLSSLAWTEEPQQANPGIKELQQKRLAILEQVADVAKHLFQNARITYEATLAAQRDLLTARLDYAETQKDRIKACDNAIAEATEMHKIADEMRKTTRGSQLAVLAPRPFCSKLRFCGRRQRPTSNTGEGSADPAIAYFARDVWQALRHSVDGRQKYRIASFFR